MIDTSGYLLLLVTSGYAIATVNFRRHPLRQGSLVFLSYDEVFFINQSSADFSTRFVSLAYELTDDVTYCIPSTNFWDALYEYPVFRPSVREWELLSGWWSQMEWINREGYAPYRDELLKSSFYTLLLAIDGKISKQTNIALHSHTHRGWKIMTEFYKLLYLHCRETRDVQFYADKLCITTTYLYKLCRKILQSSPKEEIDKQTISEIKTYLANTDLSIKSIAGEMNFEDTSYMCRYFRRQTGMSPMDYRSSLLSSPATSAYKFNP